MLKLGTFQLSLWLPHASIPYHKLKTHNCLSQMKTYANSMFSGDAHDWNTSDCDMSQLDNFNSYVLFAQILKKTWKNCEGVHFQ